jgi:hypothetical protein
MDKRTEHKQWEICAWCGSQMIPHPRMVITEGNPWLVCPKDIEYYRMSWEDKQKLPLEQRPKQVCVPPPVLAAPFVHGAYYRGVCRNAHVARYNAETNKFVYMREKFGHVYPEDICHAGNDNGFDLFQPYALMENPPFEIPLLAR